MADPLDFSDLAIKATTKDPLDFSDLAIKVPDSTPQQTVEEFGGSEFGRGVARGALVSASGFLNFADMMVDSPKMRSIADSLLSDASKIPTKAGSIKDVLADPAMAPAYISRVVGELAPQAVLAYLTGGTGAAIGRGVGLGSAGVRTATGVGAAASSIPQEVGHIYKETGSKGAALTYGIPAGALDALSAERIIGKVFRTGTEEASRRAWRQVVRDAVKDVPKSAGVESVTEATQEALALLANKSADETYGLLTEDNGWRVLESAVAGAIGGGVLGGGMGLVQLPVQQAARQQRADEIRLTRQVRDAVREIQRDRQEAPETGFVRTPAQVQTGAESTMVDDVGVVSPVDEFVSRARPKKMLHPASQEVPPGTTVVVQAPFEEVPGYVQIDLFDQSGNNIESTNPTEMRQRGYNVPDFSGLPQGKYSYSEASILAVMTPEERQDYLGRKAINDAQTQRQVNAQQSQTPTVPVQAPAPVAQEEQAQSLPPDTEGVRPPEAPAIPVPEGFIAVTDLATVKAMDLNKVKTPITIQYDPSTAKTGPVEPRTVEARIALNPSAGVNRGQLLIQIETGGKVRTIWRAALSDLVQSGVATEISPGQYQINQNQLFTSPFIKKDQDKSYAAYKLPTEALEQSIEIQPDAVIVESAKGNPFLAAVLTALQPSIDKIRGLAGARTGGGKYAGKSAKKLAEQVRSYINRALEQEILAKSKSLDQLSEGELEDLATKSKVRKMIRDKTDQFTEQDVQDALIHVASLQEVQDEERPREEVSLEDVMPKGRADQETGVVSDAADIGATWDPARTDNIIGQIEDRNPKLYQMFEADPNNDKAWEAIERELVKFFNGDKIAAEMMAEAVRQRRMEGWMALPGAVLEEFEEHNWLTGISATGKDGILALLENRNIQIDPDIRRIGLALLKRISPKYLSHLTLNIDATGSVSGEFIPWAKTAKIAMNSTDPTVAAHEISHYLAQFLTSKERGEVAAARAAEIALARTDQANREFFTWLDSQGGSATSSAWTKWKNGTEIDPRIVALPGTPFRFATSTEIALRTAKPFGITPDKNGFVQKNSLLAKMKNQVAADEIAALQPILAGLPDRVNASLLADRLRADGPQLEVVKLDAKKAQEEEEPISRQAEEFNTLRHTFYDPLDQNTKDAVDNFVREYLEDKDSADTNSWFLQAIDNSGVNPGNDYRWFKDQLKRYAELSEIVGPRGWQVYDTSTTSGDSATFNYQFVNPKPLSAMQGAVDILVRIPFGEKKLAKEPTETGTIRTRNIEEGLKFTGGHFGASDKNIVGWVRAYIETMPNGERVFHVFEVQSDWAARMRDEKERGQWVWIGDNGSPSARFKTKEDAIRDARIYGEDLVNTVKKIEIDNDDPILAYYESSALKAAIRHAKELGINKIAISDSETAALTEGHDKVVAIARKANGSMVGAGDMGSAKRVDEFSRIVRKQPSAIGREYKGELVGGGEYFVDSGLVIRVTKEPFLGGDQSHYDKSLPDILKKITGSAPVVVDFGVHQNAVSERKIPDDLWNWDLVDTVPWVDSVNFKENMRHILDKNGIPSTGITTGQDNVDFNGRRYHVQIQGDKVVLRSHTFGIIEPRSDLILKNPDGTPKTSITARVFDLSKVDTDVPAQMYRSSLYSVTDPLYHLINDDEFFAHYMSEAAAKRAPELDGLVGKVKEIIRRIIDALKEWAGVKPDYFEQLLRKFERGEFLVHENGGMLWDRNNSEKPKSLPPIKSLPALRRFTRVDQGTEEQQLTRTLAHEQNEPLVEHARSLFGLLSRSVRSELPGVASRLATLSEIKRQGGPVGGTPLKHYAVLVNALAIQEEGSTLRGEIENILEKIQAQQKKGDVASQAEVVAAQLEKMAQESISGYKNQLLAEQRRTRNDGVAQGLNEAIKSLDSLRDSTESLKLAIDFIAEGVTLEELNNPALTTQQIVDAFKSRIMTLTGAPTWQQAVIPSGRSKPGVNNEQLRIAVRVLQENQQLVQDLITYKELSDPGFAKIIREGQKEFEDSIASLTYRELRSFLKSYYSIRSSKDRARKIYIQHRARLKDLIDQLDTKVQAEDFLYGQVINSVQFRNALSDAARQGFQSTELVRDNSGSDVLKRTYYNPLNMEESIEIIDGTTKADYERNVRSFEQVATWFEDARNSPSLDPLLRESMDFELFRIHDQEMENSMYNPETGKRADWWLNAPSRILANLTGNSLQYAMSKIGGRAAVQAASIFTLRSEARRRAAEVRHELQYPLQRSILEATKGHTITRQRWIKEVAEPILASYNSVGSKQIKSGDTTRYGHRVSGADMEAVRQMKRFADAMSDAVKNMDLHSARLHPVRVKEVLSGREILRPQQGGTENIVPRRINQAFLNLLQQWQRTKGNRKASDAVQDLAAMVQSGAMFQEMVISHIYSTQRYPDYANQTRFRNAYREIYSRILNGNTPASFNEVLDIVFQGQSGQDVATQMSMDEIQKEIIVKELDQMVNKVLDERSRDRAADTPGMSVRVESADNFLTRSRGEMIAPDSAYQYSVVTNDDIRWMTRSVLEVHEQMARDGLEKVGKMLQEYVAQWEEKSRAPQEETIKLQLSGEDWLNYREAKQMLNQVRGLLDKTSPESFRSFIDEQFGGTARRAWSILIQSLLQSATVLKNNLLGMNLRLWQFEQQWRGDGLWMGMPKWLLKVPTMAKNGIYYPARDLPAFIASSYAYEKALKKVGVKVQGKDLIGEDALRAIIHDPSLAKAAASQVNGQILKRAVDIQRMRDLGAAGPYGIKDQWSRYVGGMFLFGGEMEYVDPTTSQKVKGGINSLLGLFQETGGGVMLPKALAPRKLEQFLNFQAMRHADRLVHEVTLNVKEAIRNRSDNGLSGHPITDMELLGDPTAKAGDAIYMRKMFSNAGLNLDALIEHMKSDPGSELLTPSEWNSFALEVAKEMNMPSADNRVTYKSGFARLMSSLMGYGMWYNERLAEALARDSRKKFDLAAVYRGMFFLGVIISMGVFVGTPLQRWLKRLFYEEEDQTGHFSSDNTAWRNAGVLWEQTAPFWPIIGSVMNQLYDARTGGGKLFNFLPISAASQALQSANEIGQTGNVFYPMVKLMRLWLPNTKIVLNRIPQTEGLVEVSAAARTLRSTATGEIEIRTPKVGGAVRYSPISTQVQMAVNELARQNPDYDSIRHYRSEAVRELVKRGSTKQDAERRFDLSVLTRFPENTVFGRPLTDDERNRQMQRMTQEQARLLSGVEDSFDRYATTFGLRKPSASRMKRVGRSSRSISGISRRSRRRSRAIRNRSLIRRRSRRLVRA